MLEEGEPGSYGPTHRLMVNGREITDVNELSEREYLQLFAKRPGMYIGYESVRGVVSFLNGFDYAARHHGGQGLDGFREWLLTNHVRRKSSLAWWALIENIALPDKEFGIKRTPEQEAHVLAVLFDLLDTFLAERETVA